MWEYSLEHCYIFELCYVWFASIEGFKYARASEDRQETPSYDH
jgi:hypothetical protein